jgi:hypothetical protein
MFNLDILLIDEEFFRSIFHLNKDGNTHFRLYMFSDFDKIRLQVAAKPCIIRLVNPSLVHQRWCARQINVSFDGVG